MSVNWYEVTDMLADTLEVADKSNDVFVPVWFVELVLCLLSVGPVVGFGNICCSEKEKQNIL